MNVLVTGSGKSGSWQIRGVELGRAMGATVLANAIDIGPFDVALVVKRPPAELVRRIHDAAVPLVWDIVDAWPQPHGNDWTRDECMAWLRVQVQAVRPAAIVAPTQAMAEDCAEFGVPVLALPHHARPGQRVNPIRPLRCIGYEGGEQYVRAWGRVMAEECRRRGLRWVVNPESLHECDIVVAVRDQVGYAPRHWKSNVKLANAQGSGTPIVCSREAGYLETAAGGVLFADTREEMSAAIDWLMPETTRRSYSRALIEGAPTLTGCASALLQWIKAQKF